MRSPLKAGMTGFTLIELSIVLVIIGLIVGGVLVGQDLIKASEIRVVISEKEEFQLATRTFQLKYGGLPGDLPANKATMFGFEARTGGAGSGDGNGKIEPLTRTSIMFCGEHRLFWDDLSSSKLIRNDLTSNVNTCPPAPDIQSGDIGSYIPVSKGIKGCKWLISESHIDRNNHLFLIGINRIEHTNGSTDVKPCLTPTEANTIDQKIDDGFPITGRAYGVRHSSMVSLSGNQFYASSFVGITNPAAGDCVDSDGGSGGSAIYATNSEDAKDEIGCGGLSFRF